MEDFATAMKLYDKLQQSSGAIEHETEDIACNYSAARAQNAWITGRSQNPEWNPHESYEVFFNLAYELIATGKLAEAEDALNKAESMALQVSSY